MPRARKYDAIYTKPMSHTRPMKLDEPGVSLETDEAVSCSRSMKKKSHSRQRNRRFTRDDYELNHRRLELSLLPTRPPWTRARKLENHNYKHPSLTFQRRRVLNAQEKPFKRSPYSYHHVEAVLSLHEHSPTRSRVDDTPFVTIFLRHKEISVFILIRDKIILQLW